MTVDPAILAARARVKAARAQLDASIVQAKAKLSPKSLAADAVEGVRDKAVEAAHSGLQVARDRPAATAAVVGAIGLAIAHKPVMGLIAALFGRRDATGGDDAS